MKKVLLTLAGLVACNAVLAEENILIINNDADSKQMTVVYEICEIDRQTSSLQKCETPTTISLKGKSAPGSGDTYRRVTVGSKDKVLSVIEVSTTFNHGQPKVFVTFPRNLNSCAADSTNAITFDTKDTDMILCNVNDKVGKKERPAS